MNTTEKFNRTRPDTQTPDAVEIGRVTNVAKGKITVETETGSFSAVLSGKLRASGFYPVVGDYVQLQTDAYGSSMIRGIEPRRSVFTRPDRSGHADGFVKNLRSEAVVANFDYVFIITSLNQDFSVGRIARYAAITAEGGGTPVVILSKADLCDCIDEQVRRVRAINDSMDIVVISARERRGLEQLERYMVPGNTIALLGSSGAGKSTLINTLAGEDVMTVSAIRDADGKGRHTTTHRQMLHIRGVDIIDTPGMRELGLCDVREGIDSTFADINELVSSCRFSDCRHDREPGCAVRLALESGVLTPDRWQMYLSMQRESERARRMKPRR